jgi:uncharacterized protein (DUF1684 family)
MSTAYIQSIEKWRQEMDAGLREPGSWLALAGLFWLQPGENAVGADPGCAIRLPAGSPEFLGTLRLEAGQVFWSLASRSRQAVEIDGGFMNRALLYPDLPGPATRLTFEALTLIIIRRGERWGVRLWDNNKPARRAFPGRVWFPISSKWRIQATFQAFHPPRHMAIPNHLGDETDEAIPGIIGFELGGRAFQLHALDEPAGRLRLIFADQTNGHQTYPAGRFLVTQPPAEGQVWLDFNLAYNPPCAFTAFATCPLPPSSNSLRTGIEAGERFIPFSAGNDFDSFDHP